MAWDLSGAIGVLADGRRAVTLSEEVAGVGTKTLSWPTDAPASLTRLESSTLEITGVRVEFTASATVGNRQLKLQLLDAANDVLSEIAMALAAITAGVSKNLEWMDLGAGAVTVATNWNYERLPPGFFLVPSTKLSVTQEAIIDAADGCIVHLRGLVHR